MAKMMPRYMTACKSCQRWTSKTYAKAHNGLCKSCETGVPTEKARRAQEADYAFREDHMGCSESVMEGWRGLGGDY